MNRLVFVLLLVPNLALVSSARADRTIHGDKTAKIDCSKDPEVSIHSGEGSFTFTGTCDKIAVNGGNNSLIIENVKKLAIVGANNTVDIKGADKIAVTGSGNTVSYKGTVTGKGKTNVASVGTRNSIKKH